MTWALRTHLHAHPKGQVRDGTKMTRGARIAHGEGEKEDISIINEESDMYVKCVGRRRAPGFVFRSRRRRVYLARPAVAPKETKPATKTVCQVCARTGYDLLYCAGCFHHNYPTLCESKELARRYIRFIQGWDEKRNTTIPPYPRPPSQKALCTAGSATVVQFSALQ